MGYRIAVVGATGNVGQEMMNVLIERKFPVDEVFCCRFAPFARPRGKLRRDDIEMQRPPKVLTFPNAISYS